MDLRLTSRAGRDRTVYHLFWKGPLSNWSSLPIRINGRTMANGEQYLMAAKAKLFGDETTRRLILDETNPRKIKELGRDVKPFDEAVWADRRFDIMVLGLFGKLDANPVLAAALLKLPPGRFVEASPYDNIWGIQAAATDPSATDPDRWRGRNLLGEAWDKTVRGLRLAFDADRRARAVACMVNIEQSQGQDADDADKALRLLESGRLPMVEMLRWMKRAARTDPLSRADLMARDPILRIVGPGPKTWPKRTTDTTHSAAVRTLRVAVIGTAGRQDDAAKITPTLYAAMENDLATRIAALRASHPNVRICLASGGAAVADHLAVRAHLNGLSDSLVLHLPSAVKFDEQDGRTLAIFEEQRGRQDAGRTANHYHRQFGISVFDEWRKPFEELARVIAPQAGDRHAPAHVVITPGFKQRNTKVAEEATLLVAYTFGSRKPPIEEGISSDMDAFTSPAAAGLKDGGTADTYAKAWRCERKWHVSLTWLASTLDQMPTPAQDVPCPAPR